MSLPRASATTGTNRFSSGLGRALSRRLGSSRTQQRRNRNGNEPASRSNPLAQRCAYAEPLQAAVAAAPIVVIHRSAGFNLRGGLRRSPERVMDRLRENPNFPAPTHGYQPTSPRVLAVDIDRERGRGARCSVQAIRRTLGSTMGSRLRHPISDRGEEYYVYLSGQARRTFGHLRISMRTYAQIYLRARWCRCRRW